MSEQRPEIDFGIEVGEDRTAEFRERQRAFRESFESGEGRLRIGDGLPLVPGVDVFLAPDWPAPPSRWARLRGWLRRMLRRWSR